MSDEETVRTAVLRLSRPHPSGGRVIERAAVLAAGPDAPAILRWISEHAQAEELGPSVGDQGIHGARASAGPDQRKPLRYVVSATALSPTKAADS
jgi:hypothetical protein